MLKGAIFDADGTLLDSMPIWHELGERYLKGRGIRAEDGLSEILYPMSLEEGSRYLKGAYGLSDSIEGITADMLELIRSFYLNEVTLKPGVAELLCALKARNIPMIVATSNDKALLHAAFSRLHIDDCFEDILSFQGLHFFKR